MFCFVLFSRWELSPCCVHVVPLAPSGRFWAINVFFFFPCGHIRKHKHTEWLTFICLLITVHVCACERVCGWFYTIKQHLTYTHARLSCTRMNERVCVRVWQGTCSRKDMRTSGSVYCVCTDMHTRAHANTHVHTQLLARENVCAVVCVIHKRTCPRMFKCKFYWCVYVRHKEMRG
jgi:hypothetical protein